jgi:hypothetical protein
MKNSITRYWLLVLVLSLVTGGAVSSYGGDVLIVGDSLMKSVAREFRKACAANKMKSDTFTSIGSGLARLDLLDWNAEMKKLMAKHKPGTVLVLMGANDNQAVQGGSGVIQFGTKSWEVEYGRRCGKMMDIMIAGGAAQIYWFGLPCMREKKLDADAKLISRIIKQQAATRPAVKFVPTYSMFSKNKKYSPYIIKKSGMPLNVRADDGIHFNRNGAKFLVDKVSPLVLKK